MGQAVLSQGRHEHWDAKRAVDIGATGIMVSNHGGRQLDGSRSPFDQLAEIVDAVGDRIDVICDGGITRGTHVLKALSVGAKACSGGRFYLYALAAAGQAGKRGGINTLTKNSHGPTRGYGHSDDTPKSVGMHPTGTTLLPSLKVGIREIRRMVDGVLGQMELAALPFYAAEYGLACGA